jgi:diguanylate cyclase (GGDEF)-like protein
MDAHAARYGRPLSIALADLDHFKRVNDTYGHEAGDTVLRGIAAILAQEVRLPDREGRYGGEEFLIILPETKLDAAQTMAERVRASVSQTSFPAGGVPIRVTISIGVTQFASGETTEQLLSRVDRVMDQAKAAGRDRVISDRP